MPLEPGSRVGAYEIVTHLGGGMGVVYQVRDTRLDRFAALKFLPPELTRDETAKQRFVQEAKAASALDHSNICTIYDIGETDDGQLYLVMAYYDGETLKQRIGRGPLPIDDALDIAIEVAQGLAKAHSSGIVHRDIKPANLMLTSEGASQDPRLRPGEARRPHGHHPDRHDARDRVLHVARAGARRGGRCPQRSLVARRGALRDGVRTASFQGRQRSGGLDSHLAARPSAVDRASDRRCPWSSYPTWSPDGSRIAFSSERSGNRDLWVVAAEGGTPQQLTREPG